MGPLEKVTTEPSEFQLPGASGPHHLNIIRILLDRLLTGRKPLTQEVPSFSFLLFTLIYSHQPLALTATIARVGTETLCLPCQGVLCLHGDIEAQEKS